jgi:methanogenic corrinoid protein MtbC1
MSLTLSQGSLGSGKIASAVASTSNATTADKYIEALLAGDRTAARQIIDDALATGTSSFTLLNELIWPVMEQIQAAYKDMATRLNRSITDQLASHLPRATPNNKKVLIFCGDDEPEELGGQICADLFEAHGYTVRFAGGGVPNDEVLRLIGEFRPNLLVLFATLPSGMPQARKLIDYLRDVNSCPDMQVMCAGGIYKRAEGLAEEIGADLYAADAATALRVAEQFPARKASVDQQTVGRTRRIRKAAAAARRDEVTISTTGDAA